ncbi:hypothetical protein ACFFX1_55420 [Dactylosporangium sucinum]|uniref:Uncharacterized protein n=1 Tax=Dactylosporangium sucinum TaxID=1424081 RepID=A0A917X205_9ACTN|nr:hypothetical protein [Dactylosporangium sucinum]GGM52658.1 hypothetical protein GCM10007977_062800 [Dactylosporangium sucinum]
MTPETMPCGKPIVTSLVEQAGGNYGLITLPAVVDSSGREVSGAAVWCLDHDGWHDVTADQLEAYRAVTG